MNKQITTTQQFNILVDFMELNSDLANGKLSGHSGKAENENQWILLTDALNAVGPPVRLTEGWKKVWSDYKGKIKIKLRKQLEERKKTGGGSFELKPLNALEERVNKITNIMLSVTGVAGRDFGHSSSGIHIELPTEINDIENNKAQTDIKSNKENEIDKTETPLKRKKSVNLKSSILSEFENQRRQFSDFFEKTIKLMEDNKIINEKRLKLEEERTHISRLNKRMFSKIMEDIRKEHVDSNRDEHESN